MNADQAPSLGPLGPVPAGDAIDLDQYGLALVDAQKSMEPTPTSAPFGVSPPGRDSHDNHVRKIVRFLEQLQEAAETPPSRQTTPDAPGEEMPSLEGFEELAPAGQ